MAATAALQNALQVNGPLTIDPHDATHMVVGAGSTVQLSTDGGKTFTSTNQQITYAALTASPAQPQILYGKTGRNVLRSDNGGRTWNALPTIKGNLQDLAADPTSANRLYLSLSYPVQVYVFDQTSGTWSSLTPKS